MPSRSRTCFALSLLAAACGEPTRGCDICTTSAIVFGRITDATGMPVGGASVRAVVGSSNCAAEPPAFEGARTSTNGSGRYSFQVISPFGATECLRLEAARDGGPVATVDVTGVGFKPTADSSLPYSSVRVDLQVP